MSEEPRVVIVEEPASHSMRFRYLSEGRTAGSLQGVNSTHQNENFPAIKILNYTGKASVIVSTVTSDPSYKCHPHSLVGEACDKGVCYIPEFTTRSEDPTVLQFKKLGIQCAKKKEIVERLKERERLRIDPFKRGFNHKEDIDLSCVRLCFQVLLRSKPDDPKYKIQIKPQVSRPIYNKKFPSNLLIHDISDTSSPACGGRKILLFCDKVSKDDIRIRFFEKGAEENEWVDWGIFEHKNVHRQSGIAFVTPKYKLQDINEPVNVFVQLERPSDNARSNAIPFQYIPDVSNINVIMGKKEGKIKQSEGLLEFIFASVTASDSQPQPLPQPQNYGYNQDINQTQFSMYQPNSQQNMQPNLQQLSQGLQDTHLVQQLQNSPHSQLQQYPQQMECSYEVQHSQDLFNSQLQHNPQIQQNPQLQHSPRKVQNDQEMQIQSPYVNLPGNQSANSGQLNIQQQTYQYNDVQPSCSFENNQYQYFNADGFSVSIGNVLNSAVETAQPISTYPYHSPK